jgi:D-psicose/D-tagatose/L-ribulose 3-epimerase
VKFSYVLPDPASYGDWGEFQGDLACMKQAGYDAVELQIADPARFDEDRVRRALDAVSYPMCAFQTGSTYATRGNCLSTADPQVRRRTIDLLRAFVDLAARWKAVIVFGSLQGRRSDEPDRTAGEKRIREAIAEIGEYATANGVTLAFEPVQHGEVGFHNTIAEVAALVRKLNLPGVRMMIDTFHMNIEEQDLLAPIAPIRDILIHVHLSETNRDVLGAGHWPTVAFLAELERLDYTGYCSIGVYNTRQSRRESIVRCGEVLQHRHQSRKDTIKPAPSSRRSV